eukprot:g10733.t1
MLLVGRSALHYGLQLAEFAVPKTSTFAGQAFGFSRLLPPIGFFILGTGALTACCGGDQKFWQDANQLTLLAFAVQFWLYDFWNFHHAGVIPQYWARLCMAQTVVCGLCLHLVGHVMRGCKPEVVDFKIFPQGRGVGVGHHSAAAGGPDDPARRDLLLDDLGAAGLFQSLDRFLGISAAQFPGDEPPLIAFKFVFIKMIKNIMAILCTRKTLGFAAARLGFAVLPDLVVLASARLGEVDEQHEDDEYTVAVDLDDGGEFSSSEEIIMAMASADQGGALKFMPGSMKHPGGF